MAVSKVTDDGSPGVRSAMAMAAAAESSGCMRINDMPSLDQSVLTKVGRELSYRRRRGSETRAVLRSSKVERRDGVHSVMGIDFRWYVRTRLRSGPTRSSKCGMNRA